MINRATRPSRCDSASTARSSCASGTSRSSSWRCCGQLSLHFVFFSSPSHFLPPLLLFSSPAAGSLLSRQRLGLLLCDIFRRPFPRWIQNEPLIVFGLRQNVRPRVQQRGCIVDSIRDSLKVQLERTREAGKVQSLPSRAHTYIHVAPSSLQRGYYRFNGLVDSPHTLQLFAQRSFMVLRLYLSGRGLRGLRGLRSLRCLWGFRTRLSWWGVLSW